MTRQFRLAPPFDPVAPVAMAPSSGRAMPAGLLAHKALLWLCLPVLGLPLGCHWMHSKAEMGSHQPEAVVVPYPAQGPTLVNPAPAKPKPAPANVSRPGNPSAWGEGAQLAVGRQFEPVYFDADSAEVDTSARQHLTEYSEWLKAHPRVWVTLAGHADARGSTRYAYSLGMARALAVEDYLVSLGLDPRRCFPLTFGKDLLANAGNTPDAHSLNNRVEVLAFIAPAGQEGPSAVELEKEAPPAADPGQKIPPAEDVD